MRVMNNKNIIIKAPGTGLFYFGRKRIVSNNFKAAFIAYMTYLPLKTPHNS